MIVKADVTAMRQAAPMQSTRDRYSIFMLESENYTEKHSIDSKYTHTSTTQQALYPRQPAFPSLAAIYEHHVIIGVVLSPVYVVVVLKLCHTLERVLLVEAIG